MKIALISPLAGAYSGAHEYAVQLRNALEKQGHIVQIFSFAGIGKCPIPDVEKLQLKKKPRESIEALLMYDIVHFTTVSENTKELPRFLPFTKEIKYVVTIHSCEHDLQSANGWRDIVKDSKGVIFTSESNRQYYIKNYPELVKEENSYAVDIPFVCSENKIDISKKENIAICTSRFISYKRIREFLLIAKRVLNVKFISLSTIKTSDKSYINGMITMSYLHKIQKKTSDVRNAIILDYYDLCKSSGRSQVEIKKEYLAKAKYLVDLSFFDIDTDRVQYTTLEAMDNGCVPIFHKNFFGKNLKQFHNGIMVSNPEDAANAIIQLENNPALVKAIIEENREFLENRYGSKNTDKYIEIYHK